MPPNVKRLLELINRHFASLVGTPTAAVEVEGELNTLGEIFFYAAVKEAAKKGDTLTRESYLADLLPSERDLYTYGKAKTPSDDYGKRPPDYTELDVTTLIAQIAQEVDREFQYGLSDAQQNQVMEGIAATLFTEWSVSEPDGVVAPTGVDPTAALADYIEDLNIRSVVGDLIQVRSNEFTVDPANLLREHKWETLLDAAVANGLMSWWQKGYIKTTDLNAPMSYFEGMDIRGDQRDLNALAMLDSLEAIFPEWVNDAAQEGTPLAAFFDTQIEAQQSLDELDPSRRVFKYGFDPQVERQVRFNQDISTAFGDTSKTPKAAIDQYLGLLGANMRPGDIPEENLKTATRQANNAIVDRFTPIIITMQAEGKSGKDIGQVVGPAILELFQTGQYQRDILDRVDALDEKDYSNRTFKDSQTEFNNWYRLARQGNDPEALDPTVLAKFHNDTYRAGGIDQLLQGVFASVKGMDADFYSSERAFETTEGDERQIEKNKYYPLQGANPEETLLGVIDGAQAASEEGPTLSITEANTQLDNFLGKKGYTKVERAQLLEELESEIALALNAGEFWPELLNHIENTARGKLDDLAELDVARQGFVDTSGAVTAKEQTAAAAQFDAMFPTSASLGRSDGDPQPVLSGPLSRRFEDRPGPGLPPELLPVPIWEQQPGLTYDELIQQRAERLDPRQVPSIESAHFLEGFSLPGALSSEDRFKALVEKGGIEEAEEARIKAETPEPSEFDVAYQQAKASQAPIGAEALGAGIRRVAGDDRGLEQYLFTHTGEVRERTAAEQERVRRLGVKLNEETGLPQRTPFDLGEFAFGEFKRIARGFELSDLALTQNLEQSREPPEPPEPPEPSEQEVEFERRRKLRSRGRTVRR
jgi:hypothetical protein